MTCCTASAFLKSSIDAPELSGTVKFTQKSLGVLVEARISGLPADNDFFALHIHEGNSCRGREFSETGGHFNSGSTKHPYHAGDLPPLLSCKGSAYMKVLTDRFTVKDIIGRTVVIHSGPDDFKTQPSGAAGTKIACGIIHSSN